MDLMKIGTLNDYSKSLKLKADWKKKKSNNDFMSQSRKTELERKNESFKEQYIKQRDEQKDDKLMQQISNKLSSGSDLTPNEMRYLQNTNPALYEKVKHDKEEQKAFERELKRCKTKDEAERVKTNAVTKSLSVIGAVKDNPNIPEGTKASIAASEMMKLKKIEEISAKFVKSGEYAKLPTDAEARKVQQELEQAKEAERADDSEDKISAAEKNNKLSDSENVNGLEVIENKDDRTNTYEMSMQVQRDNVKTVAQAETSPEAQKVKRAKAKAGYIAAENQFAHSNDSAPLLQRGGVQ